MADSSAWDPGLQIAVASDIGMRRMSNQDAHLESLAPDVETWRQRGHLFVLADGMGAHAAGELASQMAVEGVSHHYLRHRELTPPEAMRKAIHETNSEIYRRGQANTEFYNMGTTCSALTLLPEGALIVHVGDSRVYRIRNGQIEQWTFDHSLAWEMREATRGREDTFFNIPRNVITRSIGPHPTVDPDLEGPYRVQPGDTFLLCSDGLTGRVSDPEIGAILTNSVSLDQAVQTLVDLANVRGGPDNITIITVRTSGQHPALDGQPPAWDFGPQPPPPARLRNRWWFAAGALAAAGLASWSVSGWLAGAVMALAVICLVVAIRKQGRSKAHRRDAEGPRFGRGPYVVENIGMDGQLLRGLCESVEQALESVDEEQEQEAVQRVRSLLQRAEQAASQRQYTEALQLCASAIRSARQLLRSLPLL